MTIASLDVSLTEDSVLENNETFTLTINASMLPRYVITDGYSQATVTIVDDDSEYMT